MEWVAIVALLVSALSAWYARWAVTESKKANEIAIHSEKLAIFKGFMNLKSGLSAHGGDFDEDDLFGFYRSANIAEFYFDKSISKSIQELLDIADEFIRYRRKWRRMDKEPVIPDNHDEVVNKAYDLLEQLRLKVSEIEIEMRKDLRVV